MKAEVTVSTSSGDAQVVLAGLLRTAADLVERGYTQVEATQDPVNDGSELKLVVREY